MRQAILLLAGVGLGMVGTLFVHGQPPPRPDVKSSATQPKGLDESRDSLCDIPADLTEPRFLDPEEHEAVKRWRQVERRTVSLEFKNATFAEVLKVLSDETGYQFDLDDLKLSDEGVEVEKLRFNLVAKDWQIKTVLKRLLQPHQLWYVVGDYDAPSEKIVTITIAVDGSERLTTKIYPVADLVSYRPDDQVRLTHEELEDRITAVVALDTWDTVGGEGNLVFDPVSLSLTVRQTRAVHGELEAYLTTLRKVRCRASALLKATGSPSLEEIRKAQDSFARAQSEVTRLENELRALEHPDQQSFNSNRTWKGGGFGGGFENVADNQDSVDWFRSVGSPLCLGVGDGQWPDPNSEVAKQARRIALRAIELAQRMDKLRAEKQREQQNERKKANEKPPAKPESQKTPLSTESKP